MTMKKDQNASSAERPLTICIAEDRPACEPGVRLLLRSLARAEPGCSVVLFCPFADENFVRFAAELTEISVDVRTVSPTGAYSWNVKPQALLELLNEGADEIVWIDSDIIVSSRFNPMLSALDKNAIVVTEEALLGRTNERGRADDNNNALRARLWGFRVGRRLPFTLNSAVLRVTRKHITLLRRWRSLLDSKVYREKQAKVWDSRGVHMVGDQDVLTALLCSEEFSDIPIEIFCRGSGIIQYFGLYGFTVRERLRCLVNGLPPFVHSQNTKAWVSPERLAERGLRAHVSAAYLDASPYTVLAASLWPVETSSWAKPRTPLGAALRAIGLHSPVLTGLPVACAIDVIRMALRLTRRARSPLSQTPPAEADSPGPA